jgi:hypothetical protein
MGVAQLQLDRKQDKYLYVIPKRVLEAANVASLLH